MNTLPNASNCPHCGLPLQGMENHCPRCGHELSITPPAPPPPFMPGAVSAAPIAGACPNCRLQLAQFQLTCPNCGARVAPVSPTGAPWQPEYGQLNTQQKSLLTGSKIADIVLGFFFVLLTVPMGGIGLLAVPIVYLLYRKKYPSVALGLGIGTLTAIVLALGALLACVNGLKNI